MTENIHLRLHEITTSLIDDVNKQIEEFNKTFNKRKLIDYIIHDWRHDNEYNKLLDAWNQSCEFNSGPTTGSNSETTGLGYHLFKLAFLCKSITGCSWMNFMILDPQASEGLSETKFITHNFGISNEILRGEWHEKLNQKERMFTLTNALFGKNIVGDRIFCFRVNTFEEKDKRIFYIDYFDENGKPDISFHSSYFEKRDEVVKTLIREMRDISKVQAYVNFMSKYSGIESPFAIYAIPVVSAFLFPSCPSRSGLYLVRRKKINTEDLFAAQQVITQTLCHIDYLRSAIIQKMNDMRFFTHDLRGSMIYLGGKINSLNSELSKDEKAKENINAIRGQLSYINSIIAGFQVDFETAIMKELQEQASGTEWFYNLSEFGRLLYEKWSSNTQYGINIPSTEIIKSKISCKIKIDNYYEINDKIVYFSNILTSLIIVMLRNAWKHQYEYCKHRQAWDKGIEIGIIEESGKNRLILIIENDTANKDIEEIEKNRTSVQGTFAMAQYLTSILNDKFGEVFNDKNVEIEVDYDFNRVKEKFIQIIYVPKEVFNVSDVA